MKLNRKGVTWAIAGLALAGALVGGAGIAVGGNRHAAAVAVEHVVRRPALRSPGWHGGNGRHGGYGGDGVR